MTLKDRTFQRDKTLHERTGLEENNRPWLNNNVLYVHLNIRIADICLSSHHCYYLISLNTFQVIKIFLTYYDAGFLLREVIIYC